MHVHIFTPAALHHDNTRQLKAPRSHIHSLLLALDQAIIMLLSAFIAICASALFLVAMVGGVCPIIVYRMYAKQLKRDQFSAAEERKEERLKVVLSSGGIFFGGGMLSLLPEAASSMLVSLSIYPTQQRPG